MTTRELEMIVKDWTATARHSKTKRLYTDMFCQPMPALRVFLRAHDCKICFVSGGGIECMRPWTEKVYGTLPEQVVGSSKTRCDSLMAEAEQSG